MVKRVFYNDCGVNHNGDSHSAEILMEDTADSGAGAAKFQTLECDI